ncbi:MAG: family 78 glycoside hydrolase catalytic domain [Candidatus Hydrogenedentes bacterium]|nr:family 78 glycoside hydrolase catalytic domain [Candidatus Hydrogenedentota bacterium]
MHAILIPAHVIVFGAMMAGAAEPDWSASWIWRQGDRGSTYNDTIEARKAFEAGEFAAAAIRITADSFYRLYINGQWVGDGPARSWPDHYQYDVIDVTPYVKRGSNEILVIAKFFGIGTFHQIPMQAGLLAQLDLKDAAGKVVQSIGTDETWETRDAVEWAQFAPKQCVQMGPYEIYDARLEGAGAFAAAGVRCAANEGPWKDLNARDCPLLTRKPVSPKLFAGASVVKRPAEQSFVFPTVSLAYAKEVMRANNHVAMTGAYATLVELQKKAALKVDADGNAVVIDGKQAKGNAFELDAGTHFVLVVLSEYFGHWRSDTVVRLSCDKTYVLQAPLEPAGKSAWAYAAFEGGKFSATDLEWSEWPAEQRQGVEKKLNDLVRDHVEHSGTLEGFKSRLGKSARVLETGEVTEDVHGDFMRREVVKAAEVGGADGVISGAGTAVIEPSADGDVELIYDLGEQDIGYWQLDVSAGAGTVIDVAGIEYINPQGKVQHTDRYRNDMRYICKEGDNRFTSLMRRSGRYLFLTFRNLRKPAALRAIKVVESTYPIEPIGSFACSDERLNKIWAISARTLKLCMEDTFTDCPLYEQTHWVGDARNEALMGFTAFGSADLARRCAKLTAYSLDHMPYEWDGNKHSPLTICQTPSTWDIIIPVWSFLWSISTWDYYYYSGDKEFLAWVYPYVIKNLKSAKSMADARGLFSAPYWNMFDWAGIDDGAKTVTHNSMFAVGAIDDALKCAEVLGDRENAEWLREYREGLIAAINKLWEGQLGWYPDSVHDDGTPSPKTCVHTGFLSLLYDIAPADKRAAILEKVLDPPEGMTQVGSPFAIMYLFDMLEKAGRTDEVIARIYKYYQPMLDLNATTVWETFADGTNKANDFPTRSHCHAWSSSPIHFLNRIVLGIVPTSVGGASYRISPHLSGLDWAKGASASIRGPVEVAWRKEGDAINIEAKAPKAVDLTFESNDSLKGLKVNYRRAD